METRFCGSAHPQFSTLINGPRQRHGTAETTRSFRLSVAEGEARLGE